MTTLLEKPALLTVTEAAAYLRISRRTVYRRIADGDLPALRLGPRRPLRILRMELERFCERARTGSAR